MNAAEFKKVIGSSLLACGFTKVGSAYFKNSDDVICVVGMQKASFEAKFYVEVGYVIRGIHPDLSVPRYVDGDIRTRFSLLAGQKRGDLFDPSARSSEAELRQIVNDNVAELIEGAISESGLKALLARHPTLLYQATLRAKAALGLQE